MGSIENRKESLQSQNVSEIYLEYKNPLKNFIFKHIPSKDDAEDILQNIFYQLSKIDLDENPIDEISAWLYKVARNQIVDHSRKKREVRIPSVADTDDENLYLLHDLKDIDSILGTDTPESDFYRTLIRKELELALDELPDEQRDVFILNEMEGFSFKEISEASDISINTLISRKRYAVLHLRKRLDIIYSDLVNIF